MLGFRGVTFEGEIFRGAVLVPSNYFKEYFSKGYLTFGGKTFRRHSAFKDTEVIDPQVMRWKNEHNVQWEPKYRRCCANIESNYIATAKYDRPQPVMDETCKEIAVSFLFRTYYPILSGSEVISFKQALIECEKTTSSGYPVNLDDPKKGPYIVKGWFYDTFMRYWLLIHYKQVPVFWNSSDKVEMRDIEKIKENKIRSFTASVVHHSIALSRLCFDQNQRIYEHSLILPSFVGGTKYRGNWDRFMRKLGLHPNCFALDCSNYDASVFVILLWIICEIRIACLRMKDRKHAWAMRHLYDCIINSILVLPTGEIVIKETGETSGNGNTINDNTMALNFVVYYVFCMLWLNTFPNDHARETYLKEQLTSEGLDDMEKSEYDVIANRRLSLEYFNRHVVLVLNGDDNTFSCSDEIVGWFNGRTLAEGMGKLLFTVTSEEWDPRPCYAVDFLSHDTVYDSSLQLYLPSPRRSRILDSLLYGSVSTDPRWSLLRACALRMESWPNLQIRADVQDFIEFLYKNYGDRFHGFVVVEKSGDKVFMDTINALYYTDNELARLYSGYECESRAYNIRIKILSIVLNHCENDTYSFSFTL